MYRKHTTVLLLFICLVSFAQEQPGNRKKAYEYFVGYEYGKAALLYQKLVDTKNPKLEDMERLAYSSYQINDYELAVNWYARIVEDPKSSPVNLLLYGKSLKQVAMYDKAKRVFERYAEETGKYDEIAQDLISCDKAIKWLAAPADYTIVNEESINTPLSEFGAFPLGDTLYYAGESSPRSKRYSWTGNSFLRIYQTVKQDDSLASPILSKSFNNDSRYHVGPISSNKSGNTFFVTRTYTGKKGSLSKIGKRKYQTNRLELFIYNKDKQGEWKSTPFAYNNVKEYSVGHATLSPDEQVLYFVSDMPGSIGGTDIWFCEKKTDGDWEAPQNSGRNINSTQDEMFPSIAPNGTLYFASNGFAGMGGLDIYKSEGSKAVWSHPENLRYPVNSGGDDFTFVVSKIGKEQLGGYMSSNRQMGQGDDDIYSFTYLKKPIVLILEGIAYEGQGKEIQLPEVIVSLKGTDQKLIAKKSGDVSGSFVFKVAPNREYKLLGQKAKYYSDSLVFNTKGLVKLDTVRVALHLEPLFQVGKKFILQDIHYDFDKYNIRKDAGDILNELVRIMRDNPTLRIELSSHTDSRGSDKYNTTLSRKRAGSVLDYLVSRGIARNRMQAKGYGETQLLNNCSNGVPCSKEEHQHNRRTEVRVSSF